MSMDIQKQLDLKPYSDKNIVSQKPAIKTSITENSTDEEKSNAAKWMIGLTATAAIVLGGLYAAKRGHLGEGAEKFVKKILGSSSKEVSKNTNTTAPTPNSTTNTINTINTETNPEPIAAALTVAPLVFARKGISRLIKKPSKSLTEIMTEFQQAGVKLEQKGDNLLEIKTGKKPEDITELLFNPDGTLASIKRAGKNLQEEIFTFDKGKLKEIERTYSGEKLRNLWHKVEFDELGEEVVNQKYTFDIFDSTFRNEIISVTGRKNTFTTGNIPGWYKYLQCNYESLPKSITRAKIFLDKNINTIDDAPYITAKIAKYYNSMIKDIPNNISSEDLVRLFNAKNTGTFDDLVENVNFVRRVANKTNDETDSSILRYIVENPEELIPREKLSDEIKDLISDGTKAQALVELIEKDLGTTKKISERGLIYAIKQYHSTLRKYDINKPEQLKAVTKPLSKCTKNDFIEILGSREAVHKKLPGCFQDDGTIDMEMLTMKEGFLHVKENMTPFDILKALMI